MGKYNLKEFIWALSGAIDFVGVTDILHGKRVAYLSAEIARQLESCPWSKDDIIIASLLHDCGVSSTDTHEHLVLEMEWSGAQDHCLKGERLLASQPLVCHLARVIARHHTRWETLVANGTAEQPESQLGNLLFLADRIDVLIATAPGEILVTKERIVEKVNSFEGSIFSPQMVAAFNKAAERDGFWLGRDIEILENKFNSWLELADEKPLSDKDIYQVFFLFSECVDAKSEFTSQHSWGVACLAKEIAEHLEFSADRVERVLLAGLLHDLGKLRVPDAILDKPGPLDQEEYSTIKHHSFDTLQILYRISNFKDVALWASQHHERLNGKGYSSGAETDEIPIESRIIAVADVFHALSQDRPYRKGMNEEKLRRVMQDMARNIEIDSAIVDIVLADFDKYHTVALDPAEHSRILGLKERQLSCLLR